MNVKQTDMIVVIMQFAPICTGCLLVSVRMAIKVMEGFAQVSY